MSKPVSMYHDRIDLKLEPYCPTEVKLQDDGTYITAPGHRYSYFLTEKAAQQECDRLNANIRFPEPQ